MTEGLQISTSTDKKAKYKKLVPQIDALISEEPDLIANLANIAAALKYVMNFFWVGFYLVKEGQLVLGPFQGPIACTRIGKGKGVCGMAWKQNKLLIVPDVSRFPGHIACSEHSRSEIVLPVISNSQVVAILDVDSDRINSFDEIDSKYLSQLCEIISQNWC